RHCELRQFECRAEGCREVAQAAVSLIIHRADLRARLFTLQSPAIMAKRKAKRAGRKRKFKPLPVLKLPKGAVTLIVTLRPREGQDLLLEAELRALIAPSRKEEGCLAYQLHRSAAPPHAYLLHEIWLTRDAHTTHTRSAHFLRWNARKDALLSSRESAFWSLIA